jgi:hypothetical protein
MARRPCYKGRPALLQVTTSFATMPRRGCYKGRLTLLQGTVVVATLARRRCYIELEALLNGPLMLLQSWAVMLLHRRPRIGFLRRPPWPTEGMRGAGRRRCFISPATRGLSSDL